MIQGDKYSVGGKIYELRAKYYDSNVGYERCLVMDDKQSGFVINASEKPAHWRLIERDGRAVLCWISGSGQEIKLGEMVKFKDYNGKVVKLDGTNVHVDICVAKELIQVYR